MAAAEDIKALLKSHANRDDQQFYSIALQVAAKEARQGHHKLANELKVLIEKSQKTHTLGISERSPIPLKKQPVGELKGLLDLKPACIRRNELVLSEEISTRLNQVLLEQRQKAKLSEFGLLPRNKLLFLGPPGTGKTMSATVLATELKLPLYTVVLDCLMTRFMGETAAKLRLIFDYIKQAKAVYLFDEFDAIGTHRGAQNDVGEIRRVLNSFLLFIEQDTSESIIIAATNHPKLLDEALYRRFDDIILFENPGPEQIKRLIENRMCMFNTNHLEWNKISAKAMNLSSAEISRACEDAAKEAVLNHEGEFNSSLLLQAIERRQIGIK